MAVTADLRDLGTRIAPHRGFEPRFPDPESGVLPVGRKGITTVGAGTDGQSHPSASSSDHRLPPLSELQSLYSDFTRQSPCGNCSADLHSVPGRYRQTIPENGVGAEAWSITLDLPISACPPICRSPCKGCDPAVCPTPRIGTLSCTPFADGSEVCGAARIRTAVADYRAPGKKTFGHRAFLFSPDTG